MNWAQSHGVAPGASWDIGASALSSPYQRPRSSLKTHRCSEIGEAHVPTKRCGPSETCLRPPRLNVDKHHFGHTPEYLFIYGIA